MNERPCFWLLDGHLDFKLTMLAGPGARLVEQHNPIKRLFILFGSKNCKGLIVRYLKLNKPIAGLLFYFTAFVISRLAKKKILFFMHNYHEHTAHHIWANDIVRYLMLKSAYKIFVFDEQMKNVLPPSVLSKSEVLGFGPILEHLQTKKDRLTSDQKSCLSAWLSGGDVDLISVTTARRTELQSWLEALPDGLRALIIDPNGYCSSPGENIFVLHAHIYASWSEIAPLLGNAVGILAHNNFSVPTSLYLYAELGVPVLSANVSPIRQIVDREQIGLACVPQSIGTTLKTLSKNRECFSGNCKEFIARNSWEESGSRLRIWL